MMKFLTHFLVACVIIETGILSIPVIGHAIDNPVWPSPYDVLKGIAVVIIVALASFYIRFSAAGE